VEKVSYRDVQNITAATAAIGRLTPLHDKFSQRRDHWSTVFTWSC